jgi:2-aminoadipate transaminase
MPVSAIRELLKITEHPEIISFAGGMPAPELFPVPAIAEAHADVLRSQGPASLQYSISEGWRPLREWIAGRMQRKGIDTGADRVLITNGSQQGIDLIAKVFLDAGDSVVVENPCYLAALQSFSGYEENFIAIDSDDDGMRVDLLENASSTRTQSLSMSFPSSATQRHDTNSRASTTVD